MTGAIKRIYLTNGRAVPTLFAAGVLVLTLGFGPGPASARGDGTTPPARFSCGDVPAAPLIDDRCESVVSIYNDASMYEDETYVHADDNLITFEISPTGDRLFALGSTTRYPNIGGTNGEDTFALTATRASTGDLLWVVRRPASEVTLYDLGVSRDGTIVYVHGGQSVRNRPGDGDPLRNESPYLAAYKAATGEFLWERRLEGAYRGHIAGQPYDLHSSDQGASIVVGDGVVYLTGYVDRLQTFYDVLIAAFDGASGALLWRSTFDTSTAELPFRADRAVPRSARLAADGATLLVHTKSCPHTQPDDTDPNLTLCPRHLVAIDADPDGSGGGGEVRWSVPLGYASLNPPRAWVPLAMDLGPGAVYVSGADGARAYALTSGALLWSIAHGGRVAASPTGGYVFVLGADFSLATIDATTGDVLRTTTHTGLPSDRMVPSDLDVDASGSRVYAVGTTVVQENSPPYPDNAEPAQHSAVAAAYDVATGSRVWVARWGRDADMEEARRVRVGPAGRVVVSVDLRKPPFSNVVPGNDGDWALLIYEP